MAEGFPDLIKKHAKGVFYAATRRNACAVDKDKGANKAFLRRKTHRHATAERMPDEDSVLDPEIRKKVFDPAGIVRKGKRMIGMRRLTEAV